jgi:hypothetical protein
MKEHLSHMKKTLKRTGAIGLAAATIVTGLSWAPLAASAAPQTHGELSAAPVPGARFTVVSEAPNGKFWGQKSKSDIALTTYATREAAVARTRVAEVSDIGSDGSFIARSVDSSKECLGPFNKSLYWILCTDPLSRLTVSPQGELRSVSTGDYVTAPAYASGGSNLFYEMSSTKTRSREEDGCHHRERGPAVLRRDQRQGRGPDR